MRQRCPRCGHRETPQGMLFLATRAWVSCGECGYVWERPFPVAWLLRFMARASSLFSERRFWGSRRIGS